MLFLISAPLCHDASCEQRSQQLREANLPGVTQELEGVQREIASKEDKVLLTTPLARSLKYQHSLSLITIHGLSFICFIIVRYSIHRPTSLTKNCNLIS